MRSDLCIAMDCRALARAAKTGVERYVAEISRALSKKCDLLILRPRRDIRGIGNIWLQTAFLFRSMLGRSQVIFCPVNIGPIFAPSRYYCIVVVHDISMLAFPEFYSRAFVLYYRFLLPLTLKRANQVVCISNVVLESVAGRFPEYANKLSVIHHGIGEEFHFSGGASREKIILAVGSRNKHKNLSSLLRAFESIANEIPHKLVLVGGARSVVSIDNELEVLLRKSGARVEDRGHVSDSELLQLYRSSELFVFPSLFEGFGLPPLEAMASGCPVCCSDIPILREVCGDAAEFFDPNSETDIAGSMMRVLTSPAFGVELAERGRAHSKSFSWDYSADKIIRLGEVGLAQRN